jgi:hypothetical protein
MAILLWIVVGVVKRGHLFPLSLAIFESVLGKLVNQTGIFCSHDECTGTKCSDFGTGKIIQQTEYCPG